ncbi:MAG: hypothetical protein QNJ51_28815 [Calothrix sp. MO_167.B12]|nr:hypothetical protein [Calothrix sp. MO_167.B12]
MLRLIVVAVLFLLLTACGNGVLPPNPNLIKQAIAIQLEQTQQQLKEQLDLDFQGFEINHLSITKKIPLMIEHLPAYHLQGVYNLKFNIPQHDLKQPQKPFDIYMQIQPEGKTWRLIIPDSNNQTSNRIWRSYLVYPDGNN